MLTKAVSSSVHSILEIFPWLLLEEISACVSCSVQHLPVPYSRCGRLFSFLYLVYVKTPVSLWRWKTPNGNKRTQNHFHQLILPFWYPMRISFCTSDGFNLPGIVVIHYNFHPHRKKRINSEINFILLNKCISWEIFQEFQFSGKGYKYFWWIYTALVQKWQQKNVGWEQHDASLCVPVQAGGIYR